MLEKTISIAAEAGEIIKKGFESNVSIEFKTDEANIVTNIDKDAEKIITSFIKKESPKLNYPKEVNFMSEPSELDKTFQIIMKRY